MPLNTLKRCSITLSANLKHTHWVTSMVRRFSGFLHGLTSLPSYRRWPAVQPPIVYFLLKIIHGISNNSLGYFWVSIPLPFVLNYIKAWSTLIHQVAFDLNIAIKIIAELFIESELLIKSILFCELFLLKSVNKPIKFTCNYYRSIRWTLFFSFLNHISTFLKIEICHCKYTFSSLIWYLFIFS